MTRFSPKKIVKVAVISACVLLVVLVVFPGYVFAIIGPPVARIQARRALSRAKTLEELREAVGNLGAVFPLRDGSWVAVRYTDTHAAPGYSYAVAHDSGGQWFYSNHHFCGRFKLYIQAERRIRELGTLAGESETESSQSLEQGGGEMFRLATSTNLTAARAQLLTMGFTK